MADEAAITMDANKWFNCLMAIYRELSTEMSEHELEFSQANIKKINYMLLRNNKNITRTGRIAINDELYMLLNNYEIWLRKIQKSAGLLLRTADDPSKALI